MFLTLQGEGPYQGRPAFFIRLAGCQLQCSFCDTYFDDGDLLKLDEFLPRIIPMIEKEAPFLAARYNVEEGRPLPIVLVLTGGEPMLQPMIVPLLERLEKHFQNTQIESNGLLLQRIPKTTTLVVSPKCVEKNGVARAYSRIPDATLLRASALKFVMSADENSPYHSVPDWAHDWSVRTGRPVYVSPMNCYKKLPAKVRLLDDKNDMQARNESEVISFWEPDLLDLDKNAANHKFAAQYALRFGFNLTLQMHLYAGLA
jgi:organic radical activating enzyme